MVGQQMFNIVVESEKVPFCFNRLVSLGTEEIVCSKLKRVEVLEKGYRYAPIAIKPPYASAVF
jgi:hypothetical protein